ncbi:MAG: methyltransferase [Bdellovibrionota bacterium]
MTTAVLRPIVIGLLATLLSTSCSEKAKPEEGELAAAASTQPATPPEKVLPDTLDEALKTEFRTEENKARDAYRHPKETLEFFGLKPNMSVVEITPGMGWYSEIIGPYVAKSGKFYAAQPQPGDNPMMKKYIDGYNEFLSKNSEIKGTVVEFKAGEPLATSEPVDMIVTFRNIHNWMGKGPEGAQAAFKTFYASLKSGGVLGVVEHRESAKKKQDPKAKSGYVKESEVIKWAQKAGFKLDKKSEINANPKDTKNYPKGVWTLPPNFAEGEATKAKYVAIGESDRMTLRFVKP